MYRCCNADQSVSSRTCRDQLFTYLTGATRKIFSDNAAYQPQRNTLGGDPDGQKRLLKAALDQQWNDIPEYSDEFYEVFQAASTRQQLTRACVRKALATLPHGFSAFDACLLHHASLVNDAYDRYACFRTNARG